MAPEIVLHSRPELPFTRVMHPTKRPLETRRSQKACRTQSTLLALSIGALAAFAAGCGDDDTAMDPVTESDAGSGVASSSGAHASSSGAAVAHEGRAPADTGALSQTLPERRESAAATDVGAYHLDGSCGTLGLLGPGFTLTAGPAALPVGTKVVVTGTGIANVGVMTATGAPADVTVVSEAVREVMLTESLPAGGSITFRTALSISVAFELAAATELPEGYTATGEKHAGRVSATAVLCSAD